MRDRDIENSIPFDHLLVGIVRRPHGVRGEVSVELVGENPRRLEAGSRLSAVIPEEGNAKELIVASSRAHKGRYIVRFAGIRNRDEAESLRGAALCIPEAEAEPRSGQVWIKDLFGLEVFDTEGRKLGTIVDVLSYPAQDVIEIETLEGRALLPFVKDLVSEVDLESRRVVVSPPAGIFET